MTHTEHLQTAAVNIAAIAVERALTDLRTIRPHEQSTAEILTLLDLALVSLAEAQGMLGAVSA